MLLITRRAATGLLLVPLAGIRPAEPAATARITFVLVNDIYLMSDKMMFDGERRGGFARLAAVVRAERTRGRPLIFAHGGDTLSPSLMSGIDQGAHIITLTNLIPPDIFVPGNHEFDFGKGVFLQRMAEAKFPLYGANLRAADGQPLPGFKVRSGRFALSVNGGDRADPGTGAAPRRSGFGCRHCPCHPRTGLRDFPRPLGRPD